MPHTLSATSDEQLARRAQQGCDASFAMLVTRWRPMLVNLLHHRLSDAHAVEDVVQQTLVRLHEGMHRYDAAQPFGPWLRTLAIRLAIDHHRAQAKHQRHAARQGDAVQAVAAVADAQPLPDERMDADEQVHATWAKLESALSPLQASVLWLSAMDGLSPSAIAKRLNRSGVSVRVLLFKARKQAMAVLGGEDDGGGDGAGDVGGPCKERVR